MIKKLSPVSQLPDGLIDEIFTYLEPDPLTEAARVCKKWFNVTRKNPNLWGKVKLLKPIPPIFRLPDELYHEIFSYFEPIQLTQIERVCKKWLNVTRSNKKLWTDALFDNEMPAILTKKGDKGLTSLMKRSNGNLTDLAIQIDLSFCDLASIRKFRKSIENSGVQNLWIEIVPKTIKTNNLAIFAAERERYLKAIEIVLGGICKCSKLRSLHIETAGLGEECFPSDIKDQPITTCKLERITLKGINTKNLFQDDLIFSMIEGAKVVEIENRSEPISAKSAYRIFELTKDTLQECQLDIEQSETNIWLETGYKHIILPHLTRLYLSNLITPTDEEPEDFQERVQRGITDLFFHITFSTPKLRELYVEGNIPQNFHDCIFTQAHDLECVTLNVVGINDLVNPELLLMSKKIKRLVIQRICCLSSSYLCSLMNYLRYVQIEELIIENYAEFNQDYDANCIVSLIRMLEEADSYIYRKRKRIFNKIFLQGSPKLSKPNLNWLIGNYPDFLTFHPYLWQKMSRCSLKDLEEYVKIVPYFNRATPIHTRRAHLGEPIGLQYSEIM